MERFYLWKLRNDLRAIMLVFIYKINNIDTWRGDQGFVVIL